MPESPLAILTTDGYRVVSAQSGGGIPTGLAVTTLYDDTHPGDPLRHTVTHVPSGRRVVPTTFHDWRTAVTVAKALRGLYDWTRPAIELRAVRTLPADIHATVTRTLEDAPQ